MGRSKCAACPVCPKPIYDQNTCGNLIKSAVDAKKCASILGIQYNDSNKNVNNLMISLQNIINKIQEIVCSSQLKYKLIDSINNMKYDQSVRPSDEVLGQLKQELNNLINKVDPSLGITKIQLIELRDVMAMLIGTIVSVSSVDGKISINNVKNLWISILDSVCLDYKAPERITLEQEQAQIKERIKENLFKASQETDPIKKQDLAKEWSELVKKDVDIIRMLDAKKVMMNSGNELQQDITLEQELAQIEKEIIVVGDKASQETDPLKKQDWLKGFQELNKKKFDIINARIKLSAKKAESEYDKDTLRQFITLEQEEVQNREKIRELLFKVSDEPDPIKKQDLMKGFQELNKKTTAIVNAKIKLNAKKPESESGKIFSMSMFGVEKVSETTPGRNYGSIMMWLFVLIIVAVAAYFLYKNKKKLKMPSLSRQISNFGRQIKAVRRM